MLIVSIWVELISLMTWQRFEIVSLFNLECKWKLNDPVVGVKTVVNFENVSAQTWLSTGCSILKFSTAIILVIYLHTYLYARNQGRVFIFSTGSS